MSDKLGTEDSSGERLMAEYLDRRGFTYEREPDVGGRRPDFVFDTGDSRVAVEVYEPELEVPEVFGPIDTMEPVRGAFETRKYDQATKARAAGLPFLVVVGSDNAGLPYNLESVLGAMFGQPGIAIPLDGPIEDPQPVRLGGARAQPNLNRAVSAIAVLQRFCPTTALLRATWQAHGLDPEGIRDAPLSRDELLAEVVRMGELEAELIETGQHDPAVRLSRLVIAHNPWADYEWPPTFAGPYDTQFGIVDLTPTQVTLAPMASGLLSNQVAGAR
jgi:hypothetical protein